MTDAPVFEDILYEKRDNRAAWIIINRPKLYNAFRAQTMEELIKAFQMAGYDKAISSIVLTGRGRQGVLHRRRSERARGTV